jgi:hypothetical protein
MSTAPVAQATACPPWCSEHLSVDDDPKAIHCHPVKVGNVHVTIEWAPDDVSTDGAPVIDVDEYRWVNGQDARDYAAAIVAACDLIDAAT